GCTPQVVIVNYIEQIQCNSIAADGSDFVVTGPSPVTVTGATATCNTAGETTSINLQLSAPIVVAGTYTVTMRNGSDGNTLIGACNKIVAVGATQTFTIAAQLPLPMATIAAPTCTPTDVILNFPETLVCNTIAANGSDFTITGPSAVSILGASTTCNTSGQTSALTISFASGILVPGVYTVTVNAGSDGNTLVGLCNRSITAGSTATFTVAAQTPIPMGTIPAPACSPSFIELNFTDRISCVSIAPNGSDFTISGPAGSTTTIIAANAQCNITNDVTTIRVNFNAPITVPGTYTITAAVGSDNNTLTGGCNRAVTAGATATFTIADVAPVAMDSIAPVGCSPSTLKLIFDDNIRCNSVAANGSDFQLTGPSGVTITGATVTCDANGLGRAIDLNLSAPLVIGGLYTVTLRAGSDNNTLLSECNRSTAAGSAVTVVVADTVSAEFTSSVVYDCENDVATFTHNGAHNVNSWAWTINNTAAGNTNTVTQTFSASSNNSIRLVVTNGTCSDTHTESLVLNNKVTADFILPVDGCPGDLLTIVNTSEGPIDSWSWTLGNGVTSSLETPPTITFPTTGIDQVYPISLEVSNAAGCTVTTTKNITIFGSCLILVPTGFTPNGDGRNDFLFPLNAFKADNLDFKVFNRWGELVFRANNHLQKWDGKIGGIEQPAGVYVWMRNYTDRD
ncbi:MAG: T9SS type B sorting domain-containing protein, partial [Sphingobacteriales bacterium]